MAPRNNFLGVVLTMLVSSGFAVESRLKDGVPEFAAAKVNETVCWTQKERDQLVTSLSQFISTSPIQVVDLIPQPFELALATSGIKFSNLSEFLNCAASTNTLSDKILDLPPSEAKRLKDKIDFIKSENDKKAEGEKL